MKAVLIQDGCLPEDWLIPKSSDEFAPTVLNSRIHIARYSSPPCSIRITRQYVHGASHHYRYSSPVFAPRCLQRRAKNFRNLPSLQPKIQQSCTGSFRFRDHLRIGGADVKFSSDGEDLLQAQRRKYQRTICNIFPVVSLGEVTYRHALTNERTKQA